MSDLQRESTAIMIDLMLSQLNVVLGNLDDVTSVRSLNVDDPYARYTTMPSSNITISRFDTEVS